MGFEFEAGLIGGTGEEGRGIALRLGAAGTKLALGSRSLQRAQATARELNERLGASRVRGLSNGEVLTRSRILFLTVPFAHAASLLEEFREQFRPGQILVDVTVPLVFDQGPRLLSLPEGSGTGHLRRRLPEAIPLAAAFKTMPAHYLTELDEPLDCDEFVCGESAEVRGQVLELVGVIPRLRWIDAGPLKYCACLEAMTLLAVGLNRRYKVRASRFQVVGLKIGGCAPPF